MKACLTTGVFAGLLCMAVGGWAEFRARPPIASSADVPLRVFVGEFVDADRSVTNLNYWARFRVLEMPVGSSRREVIEVMLDREASRVEWRPPKVAIVVLDAFQSQFGDNAPRSIIPYDRAKLAEIVRRAGSREELANYLRTDPELPPEQAFALAVKHLRTLPYAADYLPPTMDRPVLLPRGNSFSVVIDPRPQASSVLVTRDVFGWDVNFGTLPDHPPDAALNVLVLDSGEIGFWSQL